MIAAIVPAAGRSERMGRPKLTLPLGGVPVIARVVSALRGGGVDLVIVVAPPVEAPGASDLAREAAAAGACAVHVRSPTADMRGTVEKGLDRLDDGPAPDAVLIAPGDSPGLTPELVRRVVALGRDHPRAIVVPTFDGRRGHPLLLPRELADSIRHLPSGVGVNALLAAHPAEVLTLPASDAGAVGDLDTPDDYRRWSSILGP